MGMAVLQDRAQIDQARQELIRRNLSALDSPISALLRRLRMRRAPSIGDRRKSWDVLRTIEFVEQRIQKDGEVLDIGALASEIVVALYRLGYRNLAGIDLDRAVHLMPHADSIRYETMDFMRTDFATASFDAITAISVIEHGFQGDRLLQEMSRLLRPGGYFIASFDYWPDKIDTTGTRLFDMDWTIFSMSDMNGFIDAARKYGLTPPDSVAMNATDRPITFSGRAYTFGWLALQKVS